MLFNSYSYEILYEQFHWIYLQGDVKLLLVTVNNRLKFEIEIVHDLSCHSICSRGRCKLVFWQWWSPSGIVAEFLQYWRRLQMSQITYLFTYLLVYLLPARQLCWAKHVLFSVYRSVCVSVCRSVIVSECLPVRAEIKNNYWSEIDVHVTWYKYAGLAKKLDHNPAFRLVTSAFDPFTRLPRAFNIITRLNALAVILVYNRICLPLCEKYTLFTFQKPFLRANQYPSYRGCSSCSRRTRINYWYY